MKTSRLFSVAALLLMGMQFAFAQSNRLPAFSEERTRWTRIAHETTPHLHSVDVVPVAEVKAVADPDAFQGWRFETLGAPSLYDKDFGRIGKVTLDFGRHITGTFRFHTKTLAGVQDAPYRLKFTFGELPAEMNTPYDPWKGGLSRAWMQDETITLTAIDEWFFIPRRVSFRYLTIELLGTSSGFAFAIDDMKCKAVSSAGELLVVPGEDCPAEMKAINDVAVETLKECMQTVFEDGPKRDHRLWSGDLYLQSLANRYSFRNFELVKHCLYLFASLADVDGVIPSNIFEHPEPHAQGGSLLPYSLIWNSTLLEYLKDTEDMETAQDLWPLAKVQVAAALRSVREDGIFDVSLFPSWLFFDWREGLDVNTLIHCATIFAMQQTLELAKMVGREDDPEVKAWPAMIKKMTKAARANMYDKARGVCVSGPDRQVSVLAQTWMIKAGVLNQKEGQKAIRTALAADGTVMPGTPYGTHYLVDAMMICGMCDEAREYVLDYWGGMVKKGADTFWEAYDPNDDFLSPYNFFPVNSACHAWSCTPTYFICKYPEIFQK